jgi:exocyst complex protein 7
MPSQKKSGALRQASENLAKAASLTQHVLADFDAARALDGPLSGPVGDDVDAYLAKVDALLDVASTFQDKVDTMRAAEPALKAAQDLLGRAMGRCEERFKQLVAARSRDDSRLAVNGEEPPAGALPQLLPEDALPPLLALVEHMDAVSYTGYHKTYVMVRTKALEGVLQRAGLQKVADASDLGRVPPEAVQERAAAWGRVMRWLVALLPPERVAASRLFAEPLDGQTVSALAERPLATLLAFAAGVMSGSKVAERLFAYLDLHAAARQAHGALMATLAGTAGGKLLQRLDALADDTGDAAGRAFKDLVASVGRGDNRPAGPDGTVHPLTANAMHAVRRVFEAPQYLDLLCETEPPEQPPPEADDEDDGGSGKRKKKKKKRAPVCSEEALEVAGDVALQVIVAVHTQLDVRARSLAAKTPALAALFLANNVAYMSSSVARTPLLGGILGDEWVERQELEVERHSDAVVDAAFGPVIEALNDCSGLDPRSLSTKDRERVKEKFRVFNEALEAQSQVMPQWSAPDEALRERLREKLTERVLEPYRVLFSRYADSSFTKFKEKYVKHSPQDAERALSSFFEGLS